MTEVALDTSVAVPLLVATHPEHPRVSRWWARRDVVLSGHAAAETYAVLTRLPGDARLAPADAARLMERRFGPTLVLDEATSRAIPGHLAALGVVGGAVYDAMVALAAVHHDVPLATRDQRARAIYSAVGARVTLVG